MRIIDEIIARALMNDAARFQHIGTIGAPELELCILLDQQVMAMLARGSPLTIDANLGDELWRLPTSAGHK